MNYLELLFGSRDLYDMSCSATGKMLINNRVSDSQRRKREYDNLHLSQGMRFTETTSLPILEPYRGKVDYSFQSFTHRGKLSGKGQCIHFFAYDYLFDTLVWNCLERTSWSLKKFDALFTPDYSLFVDLPDSFNLRQLYKTRFVGAVWQKFGFNVIPTASWGNANSFRYCFDGLPEHSVIGVCGTGHDMDRCHRNLWLSGLHHLVDQKTPCHLIIYGAETDLSELGVPVSFIPDYITSHFRRTII